MRLFYSTDPKVLTDFCLGELNSYTKEDQMRRAFLIVPERMKADLERRYLEKHDHAGLMMAEVLSFSRLAHRLFSEAGGLAARRISQAGKALLIQEILQSGSKQANTDVNAVIDYEGANTQVSANMSKAHSDEADKPEAGAGKTDLATFKRFSRFIGRPGFAVQLATVMGDFSRYGISASDLRAASDTAPTAITKDKLYDFSLLWDQYQKSLTAHKLIDPDHDLDRLIALLAKTPTEPRLSFLKDTAVWVLGFGETRAFTTQELSVLKLLNQHCDSLTVTCSLDYPGLDTYEQIENTDLPPAPPLSSDPIYSHGLDTFSQIVKIAGNKLTIQQLAAEEKRIAITTVYAANPREELRFVCGRIREILSEQGLQRRDIGIALADPDAYSDLLTATAQNYDLPVFIDRRTPLTQSSFLRHIDALLEYLLEKPGFNTIMLYLRSGFDLLPRRVIDDFENFCLAKGLISSFDFSRFNPKQQIIDGKISSKEYSLWQQIQEVLAPLDNLGRDIRQKRLGTKKLDLLFTWIQSEYGPFSALTERISFLRENQEMEAALILANSWNHWLRLWDEAQVILESLLLSQADFTRLLRASLSGFSHSSIPVGIDSIRVGDLSQMAVYPVKVLFIVGTKLDNFPPRSSEEGYLRDSERSWLEEHSQKKFPNRKHDLPLAREWQIQKLLESPRLHLYISAPSLNKDEASLVQKQLEDARAKADEEMREPQEGRERIETIVLSTPFAPSAAWNGKKTAQMQLNLALSDPVARYNIDASWLIWLEALLLSDRTAEVGLRPDDQPERLVVPANQVRKLVLPRNYMSVSQLQKYNNCPYSYYASYLLRLHERDTWEPSAREQGSLLHAIMELSLSELITQLQTAASSEQKTVITAGWLKSLKEEKIEGLFNDAVAKEGFHHLDSPEARGQMKQRIVRYAGTSLRLTGEQVIQDKLYPSEVEWRFPLPDQDNYALQADDWRVTLRGIIDRVDVGDDGFALIDYKRGSKKISYTDIVYGTNLQLPLYLKIYRHLYPQATPQGFGYFTFKDCRSDNRQGISPVKADFTDLLKDAFYKQKSEESPDTLSAIADYSAARANKTMHYILSGDISARPTVIRAQQSPCSYCLLKTHCLYDGRTDRDNVQTNQKEKDLEQSALDTIMKWQSDREDQ